MIETMAAQKLKVKKIDVRKYDRPRPTQQGGPTTGDCSTCGTCKLTDSKRL